MEREKTYTTFQIADICGVRPTTIIKWTKQKKLKAYTTVGGHRRILHKDLMGFLKQYGFPIPQGLNLRGKRILIAEDDASVGRLLQRALQKAGSEVDVDWTQDGIEALLALGKNPPDLMILDVVMPVVDGARVLATLHSDSRTQNVKVIGITGKRLPAEKLKFMQRHTDAFYLKPFDLNEFVRKCYSLLGIETADLGEAAGKIKVKA